MCVDKVKEDCHGVLNFLTAMSSEICVVILRNWGQKNVSIFDMSRWRWRPHKMSHIIATDTQRLTSDQDLALKHSTWAAEGRLV